MIIKVKVKPNSGKQEIIKKDNFYLVKLKSAPENNKANTELIKLLKRHFITQGRTPRERVSLQGAKQEVKIKFGFTSRNKVVEIN